MPLNDHHTEGFRDPKLLVGARLAGYRSQRTAAVLVVCTYILSRIGTVLRGGLTQYSECKFKA